MAALAVHFALFLKSFGACTLALSARLPRRLRLCPTPGAQARSMLLVVAHPIPAPHLAVDMGRDEAPG
jgi:hypothetical protein